jgi:peptidoglycan/xylan/chitin deacetylase (PgdA/CDA1 family)
VVDHLERGRRLPPRSVALTFDDGYLDNYQLALPVLAKYRVPATIYLVSSTLTAGKPLWTSLLRYAIRSTPRKHASLADGEGHLVNFPLTTVDERDHAAWYFTNVLNVLTAARREAVLAELLCALEIEDRPRASRWFLSRDQIREMMSHGISFGAHTITHPNLPGIQRSEAQQEIEGSKAALEAYLGTPMRHFSYPNSGGLYPHFDDTIESQVRNAGFRSATTSVSGSLDEASRLFRIQRIGISRSQSEPSVFSAWLERNRLFSRRISSALQ